MNKMNRDKILAMAGGGLLSYYAALTLFRGIIWDGLLRVLPPINERHLPGGYVGTVGAAIGVLLALLIFTVAVEKKPFPANRKLYVGTLTLLVIVPLAIAGLFRCHAVTWVQAAEKTIPTEIRISLNAPGSSIMFKTGGNSASGIKKQIALNSAEREAMGVLLQKMELRKEVSLEERYESEATIWINYRVKGNWYSKILNYGEKVLQEQVAHKRTGVYQSEKLTDFLSTKLEDFADLNNYDQVKLMNSQTVNDDRREIDLPGGVLTAMTAIITAQNEFRPEAALQSRYEDNLRNWVGQGNHDFYAIHLLKEEDSKHRTENFILYDWSSKTLCYEGKYYQADLTALLADIKR